MLQPNSRIYLNNGIEFYEQDILFDNYIYTGDFDIALTLDYANPGFGIGLTNSEGQTLSDKEEVLLFKIGYKNVDIVYLNKDCQKTLATYSSAYAKTYTSNLKYILKKRNATFTLYVGEQKVCDFKAPSDFNTYNLVYYSNKYNIIKNINIASSIPYGWVTNMQNTNGGYIWFYRDAFEFKHCNGEAEIEQPDIYLRPGKYYLKYQIEGDCDIKPYVFSSEDERLFDEPKNILNTIDNSFKIDYPQKVSVKFEGSKGKIKKIFITTEKDNEYIRTSPDKGDKIEINGSYIRLLLDFIKEGEWLGKINDAPGYDHTSPSEYAILENGGKTYGLFDLDISQEVFYKYIYKDKILTIENLYGVKMKEIKLTSNALTIFKNVNAVIKDFKIIDIYGNDTNVIVENTIKKYAPATIYSPIIVTDEHDVPLELSSSYRVYEKNGRNYYWFTNVEREYFKPNHMIKLTNTPSSKSGTIIVYGIKKESSLNMDNILKIEKEGKDTIEYCANYYDILFEKDLRYINKTNKEIKITDVDDYKLIIVDYLKEDSYAINYRHDLNSYEIDISVEDGKETNVIYNNAAENKNGITFINEYKYVDTKAVPSENCYIVIGR